MHLAQFNIARLIAPEDDPRVRDFMDNIERINGLAERMPGFVWRKEGLGSLPGDPLMTSTISVWRSATDLRHFVFNTLHKKFYDRRADWFEVLDQNHMVLWYVEAGHQPTLAEARAKLRLYEDQGDSDAAFGWDRALRNEHQKETG